MRHALSIIVIAALLIATAVDVIAAGAKMGANRKHSHYSAPATGITMAVPSGMKIPADLLPQ